MRLTTRQLVHRVYKLSFMSGVLLSAPLLVGVGWYASNAIVAASRYGRALTKDHALDAEFVHIALHDSIIRDVRRLSVQERDPRASLPTFSIALSPSNLDRLSTNGPGEGEPNYVDGWLNKDGKTYDARIRYRGDQPWHHLGAQKSMKIRLNKGDLVDGVRVFNLLNDPTPFGLEDQIILDVARTSGLLVPEYKPVWVRINNHDMGVYRFEAQPDETLVRQNRRMPGDMISGDTKAIDPRRGVGNLFFSKEGWQKVASRDAETSTKSVELDQFLDALNRFDHEAFARYADEAIDVERYAQLDALDVVFGGSEHDYFSNHKFYIDPVTKRLEPVAWSFRGFQHEETFNVVDHPLLIRLKFTPKYLGLRDRAVYALLTDGASVPSIAARADEIMKSMAHDLAADPHWDAYKLLPRASRTFRFLARPMTFDRWMLARADALDEFARRSRFLLDALEEATLELETESVRDALRVNIWVNGHAAYEVKTIRAKTSCGEPVSVFADADVDGRLTERDPLLTTVAASSDARPIAYRGLSPRQRLVLHPDPQPKRGNVRVEPIRTRFSYFFRADPGCAMTDGSIDFESTVTGASIRRFVVSHQEPAERTMEASGDRPLDEDTLFHVPNFREGEQSPHVWRFPQEKAPTTLALGPGVVDIPKSRVFHSTESVEVAAGTTLRLGEGVSLIFHGRLSMRGTTDRPVILERLDRERAFGGVVLGGKQTAGSRLLNVVFRGGTRAALPRGAIVYTGFVNIHDTNDVTLEHVHVLDVGDNDDVIHAHHVDQLSMREVEVEKAPTDAIDLEFVSGDLWGVRILGAEDDGLDLMGSNIRIRDSLIAFARNNAISAGEETVLTANELIVAHAKTGVLAKNASVARIIRSLVYRVDGAFRARRKEIRYGGPSQIGTNDVYVVDANRIADADKKSIIESEGVHEDFPSRPELVRLLKSTARVDDFRDLDRVVEARVDNQGMKR